MPGIVVFNRRWRIGSDDFVFPAVGELLLRIVWLISLIVILIVHYDLIGLYTNSSLLRIYYIGMIVLLVIAILLSATIAYISSRGTIVDSSVRKNLPSFLIIRLILSILEIAWTAIGTRWAFVDAECCNVVVVVVRCAVIVGWLLIIAMIIGIIALFDPLGHHHSESAPETKAERLWHLRCRLLCCCFTSNNERTTNAFKDAAQIIANYFKNVDVVPTDVAAALILIQQQMRASRLDVESTAVLRSPHCVEDVSEQRPGWMNASLAAHYMRFAGACYGWPFFVFDNLTCGPCRLWSSCSCCGCLRHTSHGILNDNCCMCNTAAILKVTGIRRPDILFASFTNKIFETPFFIAEDGEQRSIVVAVRGTMSLKDALTDLSASLEVVPDVDVVDNPRAHRGILRAALNVRDTIVRNRLLDAAFERFPTHKLVVTGHSLGAGTAAILALLLRSTYPGLICFSYEPPGWLVSMPLSQYMKEFVCSTVVGKDLVPRLGLVTLERLKTDMIFAVNRCRHPKYRILLSGAWNCFCCLPTSSVVKSDSDSSIVEQPSGNFLISQAGQSTTAAVDLVTPLAAASADSLFMPGHVMYLEEVEQSKTSQETAKYRVSWSAPELFDQILVEAKLMSDHLPNVVQKALDSLVVELPVTQYDSVV